MEAPVNSMEKLLFNLACIKLFRRGNLDSHSVTLAENDAQALAKEVRGRVFKFAFKALAANRKQTAWDRSIAQSLVKETL